MPTSATTTCSSRPLGFTLLEVLVVLAILAVLTGTVMLNFTGSDQERMLKGAAERMAIRVELARQRALTRNREWGIYVEEDDYRFAEFDPEAGVWVEQTGRPFEQNDLPERVTLRLDVQDVGSFPNVDDKALPQIILFSSGEATPFTIEIEPDWATDPWQVTSDGFSVTEALRPGDAA